MIYACLRLTDGYLYDTSSDQWGRILIISTELLPPGFGHKMPRKR